MKTLMSVCLGLVLAIPVLAWSQGTSQQSDQSQNPQNQPNAQSQSSTSQSGSQGQQQMSGKISKNGKTFTSDNDNKSYKVENPSALDGQEGQHVTVLVTQDPDTGDLHIIHIVTPAPPQS